MFSRLDPVVMIESELMPLYNIYIIFNDLYPKTSASDITVQAGRRVGQGCGHLGHHGGHLQETGGPYGRITNLDLNATVTVSDNNNNNNNNNSI